MLPAPLMVSERGSFAEHTIVARKPQIIRDVLASNDYAAEIVARLRAFSEEIASEPVRPLRDVGPDLEMWRQALDPWRGHTWRQLPWFLAETLFYRRLLEACDYFSAGDLHHRDPFEPQKHRVTDEALPALAAFLDRLADVAPQQHLLLWLRRSLWGNRVDLSNVTVDMSTDHAIHDQHDARLLIDDTPTVIRQAQAGALQRVAWIADNSGLELLSDLGLIDHLLSLDISARIDLYLKRDPYFVSDAMIKDVRYAVARLAVAEHRGLGALGRRLEEQIASGRLALREHGFWNSCLFFTQFPDDIALELNAHDLLVFKGDANYRRLVEDRHWLPTTSMARVTNYLRRPLLLVRTLKSELVLGLAEGQAEALAREDPDWLINGQRGVLHWVSPLDSGDPA